jgi:hypothetical protein
MPMPIAIGFGPDAITRAALSKPYHTPEWRSGRNSLPNCELNEPHNPSKFAAVREAVHGPFRQILQRKQMSAFRVITEVAAGCVKRRF